MQHRTPIISQPPWDGDTTEQAISFVGAGSDTYTAPADVYAVIFSATVAAGVYLSPDAVDIDSGVQFGANSNDIRYPRQGAQAIVPGTVVNVHALGATNVNILEFKNKAKA